jgi:hypothetical protein
VLFVDLFIVCSHRFFSEKALCLFSSFVSVWPQGDVEMCSEKCQIFLVNTDKESH